MAGNRARGFWQEWNDFLMAREESVLIEGTEDNEEFTEARKKARELHDELQDMLPSEGKKKLMEYADAEAALAAEEMTATYRGGMRDAIAIMSFLTGQENPLSRRG